MTNQPTCNCHDCTTAREYKIPSPPINQEEIKESIVKKMFNSKNNVSKKETTPKKNNEWLETYDTNEYLGDQHDYIPKEETNEKATEEKLITTIDTKFKIDVEEPEEKEPVDWAVVGATTVITVMFLIVVGIVWWVVALHNEGEYSRQCLASPVLLHGQYCTTQADCLTKCIDYLKNPPNKNKVNTT